MPKKEGAILKYIKIFLIIHLIGCFYFLIFGTLDIHPAKLLLFGLIDGWLLSL